MDDAEKKARVFEAIAALLDGAPGRRMQITNLNKALFYMDLAALRDTGATITDAVYLALDNGPVLNNYKQIVQDLTEEKIAHQDVDGLEKPVVLDQPLNTYHYLDDHGRALAVRIANFIAQQSAREVSKLSHSNPGWLVAFNKGRARNLAPAPIDMFLALQQLGDDDPWLNEPPDEAFQKAISGDCSNAVPWL
jgi:uncharacterized phage-associated protein